MTSLATCGGYAVVLDGIVGPWLAPIEHMYRSFEDLGELERTVVDSSELTVHQTAEHILATLDTRRLPQGR
jgi:hypothetical protein